MRYFLTTAIDFVNSKPHLGTAYERSPPTSLPVTAGSPGSTPIS
jgi:hypothetical protein